MQTGGGFGKFVGQRRGDAVGRFKQRQRIELVEVTDHERDGHRLAQRTAQPQHDTAHHTDLGKGQHDFECHFPSGGTQRVGRFFQHRRGDFKHIAHHRSNERDDHDRQNNACRQDTNPHWRARKQRPQHGHVAKPALQRALHISGQQRGKHQQAPHTVHNRRNGGQQFNGDPQRAAQPARREFGQKQGNPEADRHRNQQCNERGHQRAVDHDQTAVSVLNRIPFGAPEEADAVLFDGGPSALHQRDHDGRQQHQRQYRRATCQTGKNLVGQAAGAAFFGGW